MTTRRTMRRWCHNRFTFRNAKTDNIKERAEDEAEDKYEKNLNKWHNKIPLI